MGGLVVRDRDPPHFRPATRRRMTGCCRSSSQPPTLPSIIWTIPKTIHGMTDADANGVRHENDTRMQQKLRSGHHPRTALLCCPAWHSSPCTQSSRFSSESLDQDGVTMACIFRVTSSAHWRARSPLSNHDFASAQANMWYPVATMNPGQLRVPAIADRLPDRLSHAHDIICTGSHLGCPVVSCKPCANNSNHSLSGNHLIILFLYRSRVRVRAASPRVLLARR